MAQPTMQMSFSAGEWAPALNARVDLAKYRSGAALLRNFFVDYRGGASTRPGTRYVLQAYKSTTAVRLIPFQASFTVSYMLEFGDMYIRFFNNGAPVLEGVKAIVATSVPPLTVLQINGHGYQIGEWVYVSGVTGWEELNGRYFKIGPTNFGANFIELYDLVTGLPVSSASFGAYTGGGITQRVFTLPSPYTAAELDLVKYAQNVNFMVICHPNHPPYTLTFTSALSWALAPIIFGSTLAAPTGISAVSGGAGPVFWAYMVTASDDNGQESPASAQVNVTIAGAAGTANSITVTWNPVQGATSYNVYRAGWGIVAMPLGSAFGLIANLTGTTFVDNFVGVTSANPADFSLTFPIVRNPFVGAGVASVTITAPGAWTTSPDAVFSAPTSGGTAVGTPICGALAIAAIGGTFGWFVGDVMRNDFYNVAAVVATVSAPGGVVLSVNPLTTPGSNQGSATGVLPPAITLTKVGVPSIFLNCNVTWGVVRVSLSQKGSGYVTPPSIAFTGGAGGGAAAVAVLEDIQAGNPTVPIFYQQRLVLAGPLDNPQQFNMSQPGSYYNFNISNPIQPDDSIEGTLVSGQLNTIKSMVQMSNGLIMLSDKQAWLVKAPDDGGVTPINIAATGQAYNGSSDLPPIVVNYDVLYVQSKGSIVRDLTYNFYTSIYTGTDVTVVSSHLFYGHTIISWAYAEEPYKVLWAVRSDGVLLSLTFLKEQELVGWAHSDSQNGLFKSVGTVVESVIPGGTVDALYCVVERVIQGNTVKYIERMAERIFPSGIADAWCVDAALKYVGAPASTFSGAEHLSGQSVTGLADGVIIPLFTMPSNGVFTLAAPASKVIIGLAFMGHLRTLALDLGEPTVQGKRKKITGVTLRVQDTLGLQIGRSLSNLVQLKDLIIGNIGSMTNQVVTNIVTGDVRTNVDPLWDVPGQYEIVQFAPFPATILGVIPEINVGDSPK